MAKRVGIAILVIAVWLVWVELACFTRLRMANRDTDIIPRSRLQAIYKDAPWVNALADEWKPSNGFSYEAYVGWERKPFRGQTINIDAAGVRKSEPSHCDDSDKPVFTIWMFGGSTIWGAGVPDWLTIPSLLAQKFEKDGRPVCVRNFGEKAWVSTQETIQLMLKLKRADRKPNLVIFYDGPADVYETYQSGRAGLHQNFDQMKEMVEGKTTSGGFRYLLESNTAKLLLQEKQHRRMGQAGAQQADAIASATVQCYLQNIQVIQALAREYKFEPFFFWEPTLATGNKHLTAGEEEARAEARKQNPGLEEANLAAYALLKNQARAPIYPIADALDSATDTVYFDEAHVSAEGNELVAARMYQSVRGQAR